jgi:hypothetical protein
MSCTRNTDGCVTAGLLQLTRDGVCDDGGVGAEYDHCPFGSDTSDCGRRNCTTTIAPLGRLLSSNSANDLDGPPAPPPPPRAPFDVPESFEVWVSRSLALFGTRAATVLRGTTNRERYDESVLVRTTEGDDSATGQYVYLRSFESEASLRIDYVQVFGENSSEARSTFGRRAEERGTPQRQQRVVNTTSGHYAQTQRRQRRQAHIVATMRDLTSYVCRNETSDAAGARDARLRAAQLWAELSDDDAALACVDCVTHRAMNCTLWFALPYGTREPHSDHGQTNLRKARRQLESQAPERRRRLRDTLGSSCCRTNQRTRERECGAQHCEAAFRAHGDARRAHVLRRLHERPGETRLGIAQLVATDVLAPHLHSDHRCRDATTRKQTGELECLATSLSDHLSKKHGLSKDRFQAHLDRYGLTLADLLKIHMRHSTDAASERRSKSSAPFTPPHEAEVSLERGSPVTPPGPRGAWLKHRHHSRGRRTEGRSTGASYSQLRRSGVAVEGAPATGDSFTSLREHTNEAETWMYNQTTSARRLLRAANRGAATTGVRPLSTLSLLRSTWHAALTTDVSLLGRTRSVLGGVQSAATRANELLYIHATSSIHSYTQPRPRRTLSSFAQGVLRDVDRATAPRSGVPMSRYTSFGFRVPDEWTWVGESVDWVWWYGELQRVSQVLQRRSSHQRLRALSEGTHTIGRLSPEHRTSYRWLDINVPPSVVGDALRERVSTRVVDAGARRTLREMPRTEATGNVENRACVVSSFLHAAAYGNDPLQAATDALERNEHRTYTRRLVDVAEYVGERVLRSTSNIAEQVFGPTTYSLPDDNPMFLRQLGRYVVYDMFLCYLYPPTNSNGGPFGDGTDIRVHYSDRACFPMIPFIPSDIATFNAHYGLGDDFDFSSLEYADACDSDTVQALIGPLMGDLTAVSFVAAPYGGLLRFAEGVDSLRNLGVGGVARHTDVERATAVVCGIAQLGGVLWMAITLVCLSLLCVCAPLGSACCLSCWRMAKRMRGGVARRRARKLREAVDEVLSERGYAPKYDERERLLE